jgi:membrane-associated phospholipid phosphatase
VAWLFWTSGLGRQWRFVGALGAILLALGVAYCRLYFDVHWLSDVAGGVAGGMACLLIVILSSGPASETSHAGRGS